MNRVVQVDVDAREVDGVFWIFWHEISVAVREHGRLFEAIAGYELGSSSIALLGQVGGGIYSKAASAGAELFQVRSSTVWRSTTSAILRAALTSVRPLRPRAQRWFSLLLQMR